MNITRGLKPFNYSNVTPKLLDNKGRKCDITSKATVKLSNKICLHKVEGLLHHLCTLYIIIRKQRIMVDSFLSEKLISLSIGILKILNYNSISRLYKLSGRLF